VGNYALARSWDQEGERLAALERQLESACGLLACPLTTVGARWDTEIVAGTEGGVMSDPVASLRERADVITAALEQWAGQATAPGRATALDQAAARQAASTAVDAIDALLRDLFLLRGRLVQEVRHAGGTARPQVA
jgi:hypothetical protein